MFLSKDNYIEKIQSFTIEDWKPLLELIPIIETTKEFSVISEITKSDDGVLIVPHAHEHKVVSQFQKIAYQMPIVIDFDWKSWDQGRKIFKDENFDFDTTDICTICKYITTIIRADRFSEGALVSVFNSGQILRMLKSIERQIMA